MFKRKRTPIPLTESELRLKLNDLHETQAALYELMNSPIKKEIEQELRNLRILLIGDPAYGSYRNYKITLIADGQIEPEKKYCMAVAEQFQKLAALYEKQEANDEAFKLYKKDEAKLKQELGIK